MTKSEPAPGGQENPAPVAANQFRASLFRARCPRCGKGKLYQGLLKLRTCCPGCGLDYSRFDVGDGATVFVILIVGAIVAGAALIVEVQFQPPYWVHGVIWGPAILILSLGFLRPLKTALIVQQYKHRAE